MGARESEAMKQARNLIINHGYTAYKAAKETGITAGAISKAAWYREHIDKLVAEFPRVQPGRKKNA